MQFFIQMCSSWQDVSWHSALRVSSCNSWACCLHLVIRFSYFCLHFLLYKRLIYHTGTITQLRTLKLILGYKAIVSNSLWNCHAHLGRGQEFLSLGSKIYYAFSPCPKHKIAAIGGEYHRIFLSDLASVSQKPCQYSCACTLQNVERISKLFDLWDG